MMAPSCYSTLACASTGPPISTRTRSTGGMARIPSSTGPSRSLPISSSSGNPFTDPSMSADGKVLAYFSDPGCIVCQMYVALQLILKGAPVNPIRTVPDYAIQLAISHNGRYLRINDIVFDLTTGQPSQPPIYAQKFADWYSVSDSGAFLLNAYDLIPGNSSRINETLYLVNAGVAIPIAPNQNSLTQAILSADGSRALLRQRGRHLEPEYSRPDKVLFSPVLPVNRRRSAPMGTGRCSKFPGFQPPTLRSRSRTPWPTPTGSISQPGSRLPWEASGSRRQLFPAMGLSCIGCCNSTGA